jgi:hypothetical protein
MATPHLFELYLTPINPKRFKAIVTASELGSDAESDADLPFWVGEQDWRRTVIKTLEGSRGFKPGNFPEPGEMTWMEQAGILSPGHPSFAPHYLEAIGQALFQSLLSPSTRVGSIFQSALRQADTAGANLHLRLKFAADVAQRSRLADYPWELIHDGQRFLLHRRVQMSRYIAYEAVPPRQPIQDQLRVLMVSPRASNLGRLSMAEPQAVRAGLAKAEAAGWIETTQLPQPTWRGLSTYLADADLPPQVIHFDGHGIFGKRCTSCHHLHNSSRVETCQQCGAPLPGARGFLGFEDDQGQVDFVSAKTLGALVTGKRVALIVLSACQSGMAIAGDSLFNGTAQQLIDAQVPAVVAMQYSVRVQAAKDFAEQFYRFLGQGKSAIAALSKGRTWMGVDDNQWYRPVLYLRWRENDAGELFVKPLPPSSEPSSVVNPPVEMPSDHPPASLSATERLALIRTLTNLPRGQFNELVMALNPPGGILPSDLAAQGDRAFALLEWVEGPTGPGLPQIPSLLALILGAKAPAQTSDDSTPS